MSIFTFQAEDGKKIKIEADTQEDAETGLAEYDAQTIAPPSKEGFVSKLLSLPGKAADVAIEPAHKLGGFVAEKLGKALPSAPGIGAVAGHLIASNPLTLGVEAGKEFFTGEKLAKVGETVSEKVAEKLPGLPAGIPAAIGWSTAEFPQIAAGAFSPTNILGMARGIVGLGKVMPGVVRQIGRIGVKGVKGIGETVIEGTPKIAKWMSKLPGRVSSKRPVVDLRPVTLEEAGQILAEPATPLFENAAGKIERELNPIIGKRITKEIKIPELVYTRTAQEGTLPSQMVTSADDPFKGTKLETPKSEKAFAQEQIEAKFGRTPEPQKPMTFSEEIAGIEKNKTAKISQEVDIKAAKPETEIPQPIKSAEEIEVTHQVKMKEEPPKAVELNAAQANNEMEKTIQILGNDASTASRIIRESPEFTTDMRGVAVLNQWNDPFHNTPKTAIQFNHVQHAFSGTREVFVKELADIAKPLAKNSLDKLAVALDTQGGIGMMMSGHWEGKLVVNFTRQEVEAYKRIRNMLDELAQIEGLPAGSRISDYFPHMWQKKRAPFSILDGISFSKPTENPYHKLRTGGRGYSMNLVDVLQSRISTGLRKAYFNPVVEDVTKRFEKAPEAVKAYMTAYLERIQGRPGIIEQWLERNLERAFKSFYYPGMGSKWQGRLTVMYYRGLLGGAVDTAFKNLFQVRNPIIEVGFLNTLEGVTDMMGPTGRAAFKKAGALDEYLISVDQHANALTSKGFVKTLDAVLFAPMKFSEYLNRGISFHAGLAEAASKGYRGQEAIDFARYVVQKTQFTYGVANTSPYIQNPLVKLGYQFSSYPLKEWQFILQTLKGPDKTKKLIRMMAFDGLAVGLSMATGVDLANAVGWSWAKIPGTNKTIPVPWGGMTQHMTNLSAPAVKLLATTGAYLPAKVLTGAPGEGVRAEWEAAKGLVPGERQFSNILKFMEESRTGVAKEGAVKYRTTPGMSGLKLLGLRSTESRKRWALKEAMRRGQ